MPNQIPLIAKNNNGKIITKHGCLCKRNFKVDNTLVKNRCTNLYDSKQWCEVTEGCGSKRYYPDGSYKYYDYCSRERDSLFNEKWDYGKEYFRLQLLGSFIYFFLFIVCIPVILWKFDLVTFLCLYLSNVDLIASAISYNGGPYTSEIFTELYPPSAGTIYAYTSKLIINAIAITGILYLTGVIQKKSGSIVKGCIVGLIVIVVTFLSPNDIITSSQTSLSEAAIKTTGLNPNTDIVLYFFITFIGLAIAALFIVVEQYIIFRHDYYINRLAAFINKKIKL